MPTTVSKRLEKVKADLLTGEGLSKKGLGGEAVISFTQFGNLYKGLITASPNRKQD